MAMSEFDKKKLIAVIGDEDTCVGFLLGGIGEVKRDQNPPLNFKVFGRDSITSEIEECFRTLVKRNDIAIILINQNLAERIRHLIDNHSVPIPAVLEIPSKDNPYDPSKDSIMKRAKGVIGGDY
ncbi:V-type proton ATPase subunit Vha14-1 [Brevipalpus obovatus]|uniref:V-type proton ATPase subunit Vha14-1 n=1 Tax=Brevipalpus obovatus TaxID=246614 RepID=UPI003D9F920F